MLRVERYTLGVDASGRGFVYGPISITDTSRGVRYRCDVSPHLITSSMSSRYATIESTARMLLIIEKESVFQRFVNSSFSFQMNSIIVTGQGYPSLSCRKLCYIIATTLNIPVYGVFDYNPDGVSILLNYQIGSYTFGIENHLSCTNVRYLGLLWKDIRDHRINESSLKPLTSRDTKVISRLLDTDFIQNNNSYKQHILELQENNVKAELESLNDIQFDFICNRLLIRKILLQDFISVSS